MVVIYASSTAPINPPSAQPVLTSRQVWAGLERKARYPTDFVPVVDRCEIIGEEGHTISCIVHFKPSVTHAQQIRETCTLRAPCRLDYSMEGGSSATNVISTGPGGAEDLHLTFCFDWNHPDLSATSQEAKILQAEYQRVGSCSEAACTSNWIADPSQDCQYGRGSNCRCDEEAGPSRAALSWDRLSKVRWKS